MDSHRVLEFTLNDEHYCLTIDYVSVIVNRSWYDISSLPDAPPHVEGAIEHRGVTTTIIDPRKRLSQAGTDADEREKIIIFTDDQTADESIGWAVTDVTQVSTIDPENVEETGDETANRLVTQNGRRLIWTDPTPLAVEA